MADINLMSSIESDMNANPLSIAQWKCIEEIVKKYDGRKILGSKNYFEDEKWVCLSNSNPTINWKSIDIANNRALILLLKIGVYYQLESKRNTINTLNGYLSGLMNIIGPLIKSRGILIGSYGELLLGINEITSEDIENIINERIVNGYCIDGNTVGALKIIQELPNAFINNLPILKANFTLPWEGNFARWIEKRHGKLEVPVYQSKPYQPLSTITAESIIESSIDVIESCGTDVSEMLIFLRENNEFNFKHPNLKIIHKKLLKSYPVLYQHLVNYYGKKFTFIEFKRFITILKASCINIILFTTGLRNTDIRYLQIGCCKPSGRVEILNYLEVTIAKTKIKTLLPVPNQTRVAIELLEKLRWSESNQFLIATPLYPASNANKAISGDTLNRWLSNFAKHFEIPFVITNETDYEYTAHCYRATVAGWLDSSSNLAILLIRRLFGHRDRLMPLAYLHHNPNFIKTRKESLEESSEIMSKQMAYASKNMLLTGSRGEDLIRGFEIHKSTMSSESLTDKELLTSFQERIKERITNGSIFAMMTPFGVICTRNPNDSTQTPCARISDKFNLINSDVNRELWDYMQSRPNPSQCIGKSCEHAMLGPWSTAIKESFAWYIGLLEGRIGQELSTEELRIEAKSFVHQYAPDMQKIFGLIN